MTDQTKAPERIWLCMSESTEDGLAWVARAHENDWDQCFIRADIAAEQVREAHERAERAIKALSDLDRWVNHAMASLHRDIDMDEKLERADDIACDWFGGGWGASIRDELRALKSDDTPGGAQPAGNQRFSQQALGDGPVLTEAEITPSPGRAVSSVAPAAMRDRLKRHIIQVTEGIRHLSVDDAADLIAEIGDEIAKDRTEDAINGAILDGLRWGYASAVTVEMGGGAMLRVIVPGGVGITHEWSSERDAKRQLDAALDAIATVRDMETTNDQ